MKYDAVVIGAGVMGAATAYELSKTLKNILVVDQFDVVNSMNSSQDYSRVFRYAYGDSYYAQMAVQTLPMWRELEAVSGHQLLTRSGCLLLDNKPGSYAEAAMSTLGSLGLPNSILDRAALLENYPQFSCNSAVLDPAGGVISAASTVAAMLEFALNRGIKIRTNCKVTQLDQGKIVLENSEIIHADKIVLAGGSWTTKLVDIAVPISPSRQEIIYFKPDEANLYTPDVFPTFGHLESGFYGIPVHGINAVKLAIHYPGTTVDPDTVDRLATPEFIQECREFLHQYIPGLADAEVVASKVCLYDMTPTEDFIIDNIGSKIVLGAGFSGHGFKFAPLIGRVLADLVLGRELVYNIDRLRIEKK
jgi:monomeric sarcosine oxidase